MQLDESLNETQLNEKFNMFFEILSTKVGVIRKEECPNCGSDLKLKDGRFGFYWGCTQPDDKWTEQVSWENINKYLPKEVLGLRKYFQKLYKDYNKRWLTGNGKFKLKGYDGPILECDNCSSEMQLKNGRIDKYFECTNPECTNYRRLLSNGEIAPPKMKPLHMPDLTCLKVDDYYVLREGRWGIFLAASKFPENRETRAPLVEELLPYKDQIDPKYDFILKAPTQDPEGNKAIVRFSRKAKEQYVLSEKDGEPTKWKAFYRNGRWVTADEQSSTSADF